MNVFSRRLAAGVLSIGLSSPALAAFQLPPTESLTLPNGLQVFLVPQREVPLVQITLAIKAGSKSDGTQWGLADLTADALTLGTKSYTKAQIEEQLDFYGIEFEADAGKDLISLDASLASADLKAFLPIFAELTTSPVFPDKELVKLQQRTALALRKAKESPNGIAESLFQRTLYSGTAYGSPVSGVAETISKLKAADLKRFHSQNFQPQLAALTLAGDFDPAAVKSQIQAAFQSWKKGTTAVAPVNASAKTPSAVRVLLLDKPDATETTFRIGGAGIVRNDPNFAALRVVNTILGGRFTSLLNEELRVKSGYTYGARSGFSAWAQAGSFSMSTFTANKTTFPTLDLALATYKRFYEQGVDQATLDSAKAYVKGQFPPTLETLDALARTTLDIWAYGIDPSQINDFAAKVDALTLAQANELIKKEFPAPSQLTILMIGQAKELKGKAGSYGALETRPLAVSDTTQSL